MRIALVLALVVGCGHQFDPKQAAMLDASAVAVGAPAPDAPVTRASGARITLAQAMTAQTIIVFYRGFY